jgi:hypothetical protein
MIRDLLDAAVFSRKKGPKSLYYIFPESRKAGRDRYFRNLKWSLVIGAVIGLLLGTIVYFTNAL